MPLSNPAARRTPRYARDLGLDWPWCDEIEVLTIKSHI